MKPGGNYTQPVIEPITKVVSFEVYVGWRKIAEKDSNAEAVQTLRYAILENGRTTVFSD